MAITFSQQRRKQQYFILIFVGLILVILVVVWKGFMAPPNTASSAIGSMEPVKPPEVQIDFGLLDKLSAEESTQGLEEFPQIPSLPEGTVVGRENPFIPYGTEPISGSGESASSVQP